MLRVLKNLSAVVYLDEKDLYLIKGIRHFPKRKYELLSALVYTTLTNRVVTDSYFI